MNKIYYFILGVIAMVGVVAWAAPTAQNFQNIQPFITNTYNNGASSLYWLNTYTTNLFLGTTTKGCLQVGNGNSVFSTGIACGSGGSSPVYPFTTTSYGASTSTTLGFLNGFFSTASSTISGSFHLPSLSAGEVNVDSNGLVYSGATTTFSSGLTYTNGNVVNSGVTSIVAGTNITISGATGAVTVNSTQGVSPYEIATTSNIALSQLAYIAQVSGRTTLASVATGTISAGSSAITVTAGRSAVGGALAIDCATASGSQNGCLSSGDWTTFNNKSGFAFPFTVNIGYNSTTTVIGFNGLFSTASSTFSSSLFLTSLSQGSLYLGSNGLVKTQSTSTPTVTSPITYSGTLGSFIGGASGTFGCASCITSSTVFSPNSVITSDPSGFLIATGTQLTVGNLIASTTNTSQFWGNVGLSTTTPFARLSINALAGEHAFVVGSSTGTSFIVDKFGNVGVGTTLPTATFAVSGGISASGVSAPLAFYVQGGNGSGALASGGGITLNTGNGSGTLGGAGDGGAFSILLGTGASNGGPGGGTGGSFSLTAGAGRGGGGSITINPGATTGIGSNGNIVLANLQGNVGVGTTTPGSLLSVGNTNGINFSTATSSFSSTGGINLSNGCFAINGTCVGGGSFTNTIANGGTGSTSFAPNSIITSNAAGTALIATGTQLTVGNLVATTTAVSSFVGNVGIGTVSPGVKLDVNGNIWTNGAGAARNSFYDIGGGRIAAGSSIYSYGGLCAGETSGSCTGNNGVVIQPTGSNLYGNIYMTGSGNSYFNGGNVGFGTTSPYATLSIQSGASTGDAFVVATSTTGVIGGYDNAGHTFTSGPAPTISACGTGTGTVVGDDQSGVITTATAATACTMTFSKAYQKTPTCTVTDNSLVGFADISSISTSAVTFGISSALTGGSLYYNCQYHK